MTDDKRRTIKNNAACLLPDLDSGEQRAYANTHSKIFFDKAC